MIRLWTDGCCLKNPGGAGGWAVIAERGGDVLAQWSGSVESTTNNRMELTAVIEALREGADGKTEIVSDSTYVVKGVTLWLPRWKEKDYKRGRPRINIPNRSLWEEIDELIADYLHPLRFRWVKGHAGGAFNEMADDLAGKEARAFKTKAEHKAERLEEEARA